MSTLTPLQKKFLNEFYYSAESGLLGADKLFKRLQQDPRAKELKITLAKLKQYLSNQHTAQVFHKSKRKYYPISSPLGDQSAFTRVMIDLMDTSGAGMFPQENLNTKFLFVAVDVYTRYAMVRPLKSKSEKECLDAWKSVHKEIMDLCEKHETGPSIEPYIKDNKIIGVKSPYMELISDNESSFKAKQFRQYCIDHNILQTFVLDEYTRKSIVERFIRTLRWYILKYLSAMESRRWVVALPKLIKNYNTSHHSTLNTSPTEAIDNNMEYELKTMKRLVQMWKQEQQASHKWKDANSKRVLDIGDHVRLLSSKRFVHDSVEMRQVVQRSKNFQKENIEWSRDIYEIYKKQNHLYYVKKLNEETIIKTPFKRNELMRVEIDQLTKYSDLEETKENKEAKEEEEEEERIPQVGDIEKRIAVEEANRRAVRTQRKEGVRLEDISTEIKPVGRTTRSYTQGGRKTYHRMASGILRYKPY